MESIVGIDDIGTMSAKSEGWCYFVLPTNQSEVFVREAENIRISSKLKSFHGKEFKRKKAQYYKEYLNLVKEALTKEKDTLLSCTLLSESWTNEYKEFCERLIKNSYDSAHYNLDNLIKASSKLAPPIFTLLRFTESFSSTDKMSFEIDSDAVLRRFPDQKIAIGPLEIEGSIAIYAATNAYRKKIFPSSPKIPKSGFVVKDDEDSFFIQAADLFGNFALSYASMCLGKQSKTNELKSNIFEEVFGELATPERIKNSVVMSGDDLVFKNEGAFTVKLSST